MPAVLRRDGRQVPLAALQREAAHRPRARLAAARASAARRWSRATGCGTSPAAARSCASTPRAFTTARTTAPSQSEKIAGQGRSRRHLAARHDGPAGRLAAQHVQLLGHRRRRHPVRQHVQRRRRRAHQPARARTRPASWRMDKNTGKVLWTDNSPGTNILHGQWSSPAYAVLGGVPQVIFGGGDGWLYSFLGEATPGRQAQAAVEVRLQPQGIEVRAGRPRHDRNHIIGTPVVYDGLVYVGVGEDPEHGEGVGHLWCIDPTKRGDVSPELAFNVKDPKHADPAPADAGRDPEARRSGPAESQLGGRLALRRVRPERQRQDRLRGDDAPHLRHRGDQGRPAVSSPTSAACSTASTPRPASRTGRTTCWPPPGARR